MQNTLKAQTQKEGSMGLEIAHHQQAAKQPVFLSSSALSTKGCTNERKNAPVLVEASAAVLRKMLGEHGLERTRSTGSVDVTDDSEDNHGGSLEDGDGIDDLLLVDLRSGLIDLTNSKFVLRKFTIITSL